MKIYQIIAIMIVINYISCRIEITKLNKCSNLADTFTLSGITTQPLFDSPSIVGIVTNSKE